MISVSSADSLYKIVILNPKGGCGKTTLATNLAAWYAHRGPPPTIIDCDPQGFCLRWLEKRPPGRPPILGQAGYSAGTNAPKPIEVTGSNVAIIDLPAGISERELHEFVYLADSLLLPILPSEIDVHSATRFIAELLLDAQLDRSERRLAIVANRVRSKTRSYRTLLQFLGSLSIPMVAAQRDSQNYVLAAAQGLGVCELPPYRVQDDLPSLYALSRWLDKRQRAVMLSRRKQLIAQAAYRYAQSRDFKGGDPMADWLRAEEEVDARLSAVG